MSGDFMSRLCLTLPWNQTGLKPSQSWASKGTPKEKLSSRLSTTKPLRTQPSTWTLNFQKTWWFQKINTWSLFLKETISPWSSATCTRSMTKFLRPEFTPSRLLTQSFWHFYFQRNSSRWKLWYLFRWFTFHFLWFTKIQTGHKGWRCFYLWSTPWDSTSFCMNKPTLRICKTSLSTSTGTSECANLSLWTTL